MLTFPELEGDFRVCDLGEEDALVLTAAQSLRDG